MTTYQKADISPDDEAYAAATITPDNETSTHGEVLSSQAAGAGLELVKRWQHHHAAAAASEAAPQPSPQICLPATCWRCKHTLTVARGRAVPTLKT